MDDRIIASFSRFNEKRDFQGIGNSFDVYEEGNDLEQASLTCPIPKENIGHKILAKQGWSYGQGLGRKGTGRKDPVEVIYKSDFLGLGRMEMELGTAAEATENRKTLEIEKEETAELRQKYENNKEKQRVIDESLVDFKTHFRCDLCEKQYKTHTEFDNHVNSYEHAHKQRIKELRSREFARGLHGTSKKEEKRQQKELMRIHGIAESKSQTRYEN